MVETVQIHAETAEKKLPVTHPLASAQMDVGLVILGSFVRLVCKKVLFIDLFSGFPSLSLSFNKLVQI